jgi:xylose isomerase
MKKVEFFMLLLCFIAASSLVSADPPTCPADLGGKCSDSDDWQGDFFPEIPKIKYEGPSSKNPLAYRWYNAEEEILGKKMKDWFRFSVAFWHTFRGTGGDPFGAATKYWPWEDGTNSVSMAKRRMRANFEFLKKLGVDWWCFHDRDIAPDGTTLEVTRASELTPFCFTLKLQSALLPGVINHFGPDISFAACCFLWYLITLFCSCWPNVNLFQS